MNNEEGDRRRRGVVGVGGQWPGVNVGVPIGDGCEQGWLRTPDQLPNMPIVPLCLLLLYHVIEVIFAFMTQKPVHADNWLDKFLR